MHLLGPEILGVIILVLLGILVLVKRVATGSVLDKPAGGPLVQLVNIFNLFFLLVVNPLAAILLITGNPAAVDPTHAIISEAWVLRVLEGAALILYVTGFLLMARALITLGRTYQLGGSPPRSGDRMIMEGPYRLIRHPMYASALAISLGLAGLVQSWAIFFVFCVHLVLILRLIPLEEAGLREAYGAGYLAYQEKSKKIIPFVL